MKSIPQLIRESLEEFKAQLHQGGVPWQFTFTETLNDPDESGVRMYTLSLMGGVGEQITLHRVHAFIFASEGTPERQQELNDTWYRFLSGLLIPGIERLNTNVWDHYNALFKETQEKKQAMREQILAMGGVQIQGPGSDQN